MRGFFPRDIVLLGVVVVLGTLLFTQLVPNIDAWHNLYLIFLVPLFVVIQLLSFAWKRRVLQRFAELPALARLVPAGEARRPVWRALLLICAVWLAVLAAMRPQWGYRLEEVRRSGVDIALVVDVSRSMLATDIEPSRLERAKRKIRDLLGRLEGDRVALVAFAGVPFTQCPLTLDYGAVEMFVAQLDPSLIPVPGTAIAAAIDHASALLADSPRRSKAIILITDGEDHEGEPLAAAARAKEQGLRIYAIGIGRPESAPIPDVDGGFATDRRSGTMITTALDEVTLQKIALETGGAYVSSVAGEMDLEEIYDRDIKVNLEAHELGSQMRKRWREGFWAFLGPALLLLALAVVV